MKKTKFVSGLTALTLAAMSLGMSASAADSVGLSIGKATGVQGDSFSVDVQLSGAPATGLSSIDFAVSYDASVIDVTDVSLGKAGNTGAAEQEGELGETLFDWYDTGSQIVLVWATGLTDTNYWVKDGVFVTISGTIDKDAKDGAVSALKAVPVDRESYPGGDPNADIVLSAVGEDGTVDYTADVTDGSVTVTKEGDVTPSDADWGNVNCSTEEELKDRINMSDAVLLARLTSSDVPDVTEQGKKNADVQFDGAVDAGDVTKLLGFLCGDVDYSALGKA